MEAMAAAQGTVGPRARLILSVIVPHDAVNVSRGKQKAAIFTAVRLGK